MDLRSGGVVETFTDPPPPGVLVLDVGLIALTLALAALGGLLVRALERR
ncbi:hypothetical protein [Kineococcus rhizosphaerae]|uniref:Uncharacterized protein n=1 Tax=Kineococcus rhizosphaerae TaxID=559628 RepID=A0A2T0R4N6_9ACTN|nr:hypothetical protein [Kineococcus rhizosphaerae]PRY15337.1 hypothetical protein CLV37_105265 [Kineococcus rhizosphaerae]